ncbi:DNA-deoxyinosine glycosylase [Paenibacillus cremeus]|uniref:DNA-deoxyinosine glycosylase n=1 Tax=Paenibacillus cremeus TaxID=2163881 RepID=A0A559KFA2_9BACL|nr:DNA-deoxyinosine glycosylase [Paenibacillus cremeus]TVY10799.1 DNA-deoxyinosine glycosylase [Paenibacillus cremeus]
MDEQGKRLHGLAPVAAEHCTLLLLGTMPGEASLLAQQYYGHPRNHAWPLLYGLLDGGTPEAAYEARIGFALSRGVALWDVLQACERAGSLDSAIRKPEANDFSAFFAQYPRLTHVFFNGSEAERLYRRQVAPQLGAGDSRTYTALPSSSPARALSLTVKLQAWQPVREAWLALGAQGR